MRCLNGTHYANTPKASSAPFSSSNPTFIDVDSREMNQRSLPVGHTTIRPIIMPLPPELWFLILRYATYSRWSSTQSYSLTSFGSPEGPDASDHSNQTSTTLPFHIRLKNYASQLKWKASLTRVCKEWNVWGQQFLWEDIWIASAKDGKVLVEIVCEKDGQGHGKGMSHCLESLSVDAKVAKGKVGFGLFKSLRDRSDSKPYAATHTHIHPQPIFLSPSWRKNVASYIKKLHIETPSMDKCSPSDLISILERCERLEVFIDLRSVRSGFGFVDVGRVRVGGALESSQMGAGKENTPGRSIPERHLFPQPSVTSTSDPILQVLLHPTSQRKQTLKHLTFTHYKHEPDDFQGGVWFWEDVIGRALNAIEDNGLATTLESLEVVLSTRGVGMDYGYRYARGNPGSSLSTGPNRRFEARLLTSLDFDINPTHNLPVLTLPSLHSLRIPLTSPTLLVLATWFLPSLQSLSVVSIDFTGWRRKGFKNFMEVHGGGLTRFEIVGGGESGEEEGWITEREDGIGYSMSNVHHQQSLHLPSASPHLKHFICSTNASEWNWETPDWIAPHVLMPEHFGVERIGVWGLEGKVVRGGGGDFDGAGVTLGIGHRRRRRTTSRWSHDDMPSTQDEDEEDNQQHLLEEQPFFMLQEQFGSLLRREAFPSLVCIRDMSWESDLIRKSVGIGCSREPESSTVGLASTPSAEKKQKGLKTWAGFKESVASCFTRSHSSSSTSSSTPVTQGQIPFESQTQSYKIRKFWLGVLERCDRRGVYLEDWMGRRVVA